MNANEFNEYIRLISEGKKEEAHSLREKSIPDTLIKHCALLEDETDEKKFYSLENNKLWFSSVTKLNDPYEFKGMVVNCDALRKAGYSEKTIEKFQDFLEMKEYGVVCLSARDVDYLPMWAYYTNNYKGYCIEYEVIKKAAVHQVSYEPNRIPIASLLFQLYGEIKKAQNQGLETSSQAESIANIIRQNLYIKGKSWEHEKEYRIAFPINNMIGENIDISNLGLRVKRIIAGINCSNDNLNWLNSISNKLGIGNIYISSLSEKKYGMDIEEYIS